MARKKKKEKLNRNENTEIPFGEPIKQVFYECFGIKCEREYVLSRFKQKHDREPEKIFQNKGLIWVGPIRSDEKLYRYNRDGVHG